MNIKAKSSLSNFDNLNLTNNNKTSLERISLNNINYQVIEDKKDPMIIDLNKEWESKTIRRKR
jgi:hypothetical protein